MIGVDITDINRFEKISENDYSSWEKVFTKSEWKYCFKGVNSAMHLAGIFASKEAVMKAVGNDIMKRYDLIEVVHNDEGKPEIVLKIKKTHKIEVSISHDAGVAVAVAMVAK